MLSFSQLTGYFYFLRLFFKTLERDPITEAQNRRESPKRGRKTGAARKLSKSVEKNVDTFWRFLTFFALREKRRKVSKIFLTLFDDFWRFLTWPLSAGPFCGPLKIGGGLVGVWNGWGYGIAIFRALNFQISEPEMWQKIVLSVEFQGFSWKIRPLKNIFRTLENGHSIRHQSIPPLSAGQQKPTQNSEFIWREKKNR